jgi:thiol-disulfide isomerase/thioredoxin
MRRVGAGLLAVVLALSGCKYLDPKPADKADKKDPPGVAAARTKAKDKDPDWLAGVGKIPGGNTDVPRAGTWSKPGDPGFSVGKESQGIFGGRVIDPYGKGVKGAFIRIERADAAGGSGAPTGILTKDDGYFLTQGLTPGAAYTLTAETQQEGKTLTGVVQAKAPAANLTIQLRDDLIRPPGLPPGAAPPNPPGGALPPPVPNSPGISPPSGDLIPPVGMAPGPSAGPSAAARPQLQPQPQPQDGAWTPGVGPAGGQVPATLPGPGNAAPPTNPNSPVPPASPDPSVTRIRPENTANGPTDPFRPPAANIPGPPVPPVGPTPVIPPPNPDPQKKSSRPVGPGGGNFALVDTLQRPWEFATSRHGSLVLVDFMTTTCGPCKQTIPVLTDLQARFGADGLQLVGVVCDETPLAERTDRAAKYHRDYNLNYALFVEPGANPGAVRDRFLGHDDGYPTAVLLDGSGAVVWKGHPSADRVALEAAIKSRLGK